MANHFLASIYRINAQDLNKTTGIPATQGIPMSFPTVGTVFYPPTLGSVTANGVTCVSVIEVLPTGLNQPSKKYYTDSTVSTLNTNAA